MIIFATNSENLIKSIHDKYKVSKVAIEFLDKKINSYNSTEYQDHNQDYNNEFHQDTRREIHYYLEDYSDALVKSSNEGWFYDEPNHSKYEVLKLVSEDDEYNYYF